MLKHALELPAFRWLLFFGVWTLMGMAFAGQLFLSRANIGNPVTWGFALNRALADWYVFAVLSIPAIKMARAFRLDHPRWIRNLTAHLLASIAFSVLWMALRALIEDWQSATVSFRQAFAHALVATFFFNLLIYWVVVNVTYALDYYLKFKEREVRAAELEKRLTEARLQALQMQLNPHFLFNALNSVASLMHKDVEAADRMITRLGELLRTSLESTSDQEVTLEAELSFLARYLDIEQIRFGDRLRVTREIDRETLLHPVPNLILQPLVENAIQHGISRKARPGVITLRSRRDGDGLCLEVEDNGGGFSSDDIRPRHGVGLSNTLERLRQLYGSAGALEFHCGAENGLLVRVRIPWNL